MRRVAILLLIAFSAFAADRLYLKDGSYHLVREYEVLQDRVRYFSTERGEWEEIPTELVDLERTKKDRSDREAAIAADSKAQAEEDAAIKAVAKEVGRVPVESGAYWINADKIEPMKSADVKIVSNKKQTILKVLSPIPMVPGKSTVEVDGPSAAFRITDSRPEFYFRLTKLDAVAIVKLSPKKTLRLVENVSILPVTNEAVEDRQVIPTFKKQYEEDLFKIWPEKALEPGEYAIIEYMEGAVNMQVWDFGIGAAAK
jgi:hypothetical protein